MITGINNQSINKNFVFFDGHRLLSIVIDSRQLSSTSNFIDFHINWPIATDNNWLIAIDRVWLIHWISNHWLLSIDQAGSFWIVLNCLWCCSSFTIEKLTTGHAWLMWITTASVPCTCIFCQLCDYFGKDFTMVIYNLVTELQRHTRSCLQCILCQYILGTLLSSIYPHWTGKVAVIL